MKTIYKTIALGAFFAVVAFVAPTFAQDACTDVASNTALYDEILRTYKGNHDQRKVAVKSGQEYLNKYKNCQDYAAQIEWLTRNVPKWNLVLDAEQKVIDTGKRYDRFNKAIKSNNIPEIFASGDDILKYEPDFLDVMIVLASVGLDEAAKGVDTYNGKAVDYAKSVIKKIDGGATSEKFGAHAWEYDTKENALGWMNYTIGYVEYYRYKRIDSGLDYFYKATQLNSETKDRDFIYALMGDKYFAKAEALNEEIVKLIEKNEMQESFESKSKLALSKGYVDRAIDAYSRAYSVAKSNMNKETKADLKAQKKKYMDGIFETLKGLYKFRYETVEQPIDDAALPEQLNSHIASVTATELPNPSSAVEPVDPPSLEEEMKKDSTSAPSTTTSGDSGSSTVKPPTPTPSPVPANKSATVKSDADKTNNKPNQY